VVVLSEERAPDVGVATWVGQYRTTDDAGRRHISAIAATMVRTWRRRIM
jgi:hypothetical protein